MSSGEDYKNMILLNRNVSWQYRLDDYSTEALKTIQKSLDVARNDLLNTLGNRDFRLPPGREHAVLKELNDMTLGIQSKLTGDIRAAAVTAGEYSLREYNSILSFDGQLDKTVGFNAVSLSPDQLRALVDTPVGGKLMTEWVKDSFAGNIERGMGANIMTGVLQGLSTDKIITGMESAFGLIRKDAETLVRTSVAQINNDAAKAVYQANSDIISEVEWNASLEVGPSGRSTCLACAVCDGRRFKMGTDHISPPLHLRCRCFLLPVTKSYKSLGLNIDEMKASTKAFSERGENRKILAAGQYEGKFKDFLDSRSVKYKKDLLGPNRYKLMGQGVFKWDDMVNAKGEIRLLKKNKAGEYIGLE